MPVDLAEHIDACFHLTTMGMPDHCILDAKGEPSFNQLFAVTLGLNRKDRKDIEKKDGFKTISFRSVRVMRFIDHTDTFVEKKISIPTLGDKLASWEAHVFQRHTHDWHLLSNNGETAFLSDSDQKELIEDYAEYSLNPYLRRKKEFIKRTHQGAIQRPTKAQIAHLSVMALQVVDEALRELTQWSKLDSSRRELLADVIFAGFSLFGPKVIHHAVKEAPEVLEYYKFVMKHSDNRKLDESDSSDDATEDDDSTVNNSDPLSPRSLKELYTLLKDLAAKGENEPESQEIHQTIKRLINEHYDQLKSLPRIEPAEINRLILMLSDLVVRQGKAFSIEYFEDQDFQSLLIRAWTDYLYKLLAGDTAENALCEIHCRISELSKTQGQQLSDVRTRMTTLEGEAQKAKQELTNATFVTKKAALARVESVEDELRVLRRELQEKKDSVVQEMLPHGYVLPELSDLSNVPVTDQSAPSASGQAALLHFQSYLENISDEDPITTPQDPPQTPVVTAIEATTEVTETVSENSAHSVPDSVTPEESPLNAVIPEPIATETPAPVANSAKEPSTKIQDEPPVVTPIPSSQPVGGAASINLTTYLSNKREACKRYQECLDTMGVVPAITTDNLALHWLNQGELPLAIATLSVAERLGTATNGLPVTLFNAAYQGMHIWRGDNATVNRILSTMNQLQSDELENLSQRKPGGRIVPYLLFAATFQPSMFAGNLSIAPRLLLSVSSHFDGPVVRMIEELVNFTDRNNRLDIDSLRDLPMTDDKDRRIQLGEHVKEWQDRILNKQTGWAPARKAMKNCLERGDFADTIRCIANDDASGLSRVMQFTNVYREIDEQTALMNHEISIVQNDFTGGAPIAGNARTWFHHTLNEIVAMADRWVGIHQQLNTRTTDTTQFARRFLTMATASVNHLKDRGLKVDNFEQKIGMALCRQVLQSFSLVAEQHHTSLWDAQRVNHWLNWPNEWLHRKVPTDNASKQMMELINLLEQGFDANALYREAREDKNFPHAHLLSLYLKDKGSEVGSILDELTIEFAEEKRTCLKRSDHVKTMLDNANVASLIVDEKHYQLSAEIEHLKDQLLNLPDVVDLTSIRSSLDEMERDLDLKFSERTRVLNQEMDTLVNRARLEQGVDSVPANWIELLRTAIQNHETTVAEEMLEHLKTSIEEGYSLSSKEFVKPSFLSRFLEVEGAVYTLLAKHPNPQDALVYLNKNALAGLDFAKPHAHFKRGIEDLMSMKSRVKVLDMALYERIVHILAAVGIEAEAPSFDNQTAHRVAFTAHAKFCQLSLLVVRKETGRGLRFFGSSGETDSIDILIAHGDWKIADLKRLFEEQSSLNSRTLLITSSPLSIDIRNEFSTFCKTENHTLHLVDPVVMIVLAGLGASDSKLLPTYVSLSLPWTAANPYNARQMMPAPQEMRYGRTNDLKQLGNMQNGAAIIFGGRQLGKTTLLEECTRRSNNPLRHQHAFLRRMDGNLDRANLSGNELERHRELVWRYIYDAAVDAGLFKDAANLTTDIRYRALTDYFKKPSAESLIVCFDEIDRILGLDAANGFRIFREITALVSSSNGHFKVIIAGLENVRRFADAPNYPLHQLGSSIQVSILASPDAIQLIREPLSYLGYEFESSLVVNRILVETNRHPGLIHYFCYELIKYLSKHNAAKVGQKIITINEIDEIRRQGKVSQLISERFEDTLMLDSRYRVLAYSLIAQGATSYSASRAKSIAENWAPDIFKSMMGTQFEAFMDELCGLGVFTYMRRGGEGKEYALRNAKILDLMGGKQKIEGKLIEALDSLQDNDPLDGHAYTINMPRPSPLTLRDEKLLIIQTNNDIPASTLVNAQSSIYSVGIIAGSEALGLNAKWMEEALPLIGEEEPALHGPHRQKYTTNIRDDKDFLDTSIFKKRLVEGILGAQALKTPIMQFIRLTGDMPIAHTMDLLDIAHEVSLEQNSKHYRMRILFLMPPKVLWEWQTHPELTKTRDEAQPFVVLDRWKNTALSHLLNRLQLENTDSSVKTLASYTQGWYFSVDQLLSARNKHASIEKLTGLTRSFTPLLESKPKGLDEFLAKVGLNQVPWGIGLVKALAEMGEFDMVDLEYQVDAIDSHSNDKINYKDVERWLSRLRIIELVNPNRGELIYRVNKSISVALSSKVALESIS